MLFSQMNCNEFTAKLSSSDPLPGSGGAAALAGAIGISMGLMVGSRTLNNKKYKNVWGEMTVLTSVGEGIRQKLIEHIDSDAEAYGALKKVMMMSEKTAKDQELKLAERQDALKEAISAPLEIMRLCCTAIELIEVFAQKGSAFSICDAGVGVKLCKAALEGASLVVFVNTKEMADQSCSEQINAQADDMLKQYKARADKVYEEIQYRLKVV